MALNIPDWYNPLWQFAIQWSSYAVQVKSRLKWLSDLKVGLAGEYSIAPKTTGANAASASP